MSLYSCLIKHGLVCLLPPLAGDIVCPEWPVEDVEDNESHRKNVHENRVGFGQSAITTIMTCIDRDEGKTNWPKHCKL